MSISSATIQNFFKNKSYPYVNETGMLFYHNKEGLVQTECNWYGIGPVPFDVWEYDFRIIIESETPEEFTTHFALKQVSDIETLEPKQSWMLYLNGLAEMHVHPTVIEADFAFRIKGFQTMVQSLQLHFFDIVPEHLTVPEQFVEYFTENEKLISHFVAIRWKY